MKRKDTRPLTVNGVIWEYKIGRNTVAIYAPDGKRFFPKFTDIVGEKAVKENDFQLNPAVLLNYIYKNITPNMQKHMCKHCSRRRNDVVLRVNPFDAEIYNKENKEYICNECYDDLCNEI
jgi:hypothetical protein